MTESIWLPYHMGIMETDGRWKPMCGSSEFHAKSAICYEFWRFLELAKSQKKDWICEECRDHPDFVWHHLGSL